MARQANAVTRGSIVVGAAAATSLAIIATSSTPWMVVPIVFGTLAAVYGFRSLWLWKSVSAQLTNELVKLYERAEIAKLRDSFISDRTVELAAARSDLDRKNRLIRTAMILAAVSWVFCDPGSGPPFVRHHLRSTSLG